MNRLFKTTALSIILILGLGCSSSKYNLNRIRQQDEAFNKEIMLSSYETDAYGKESRIAEIYGEYGKLFTDENLVRFLKDRIEKEPNPREKKRAEFLYRDISSSFLGERTKELDDRIFDLQAKEKIVVGKDTIAFRDIDVLLSNEKNGERRKDLYYSQGEMIIDKINPLLIEELNILEKTVKELGYR
ncbi:MAG: hypothetical protein MUO85_02585, partial [candidate division Zixibacteria bacterium]|nr:hypothetical protein [candidate division Zixibacteria bacterium]